MPPAIRPRASWSPPSVGLIWSKVCSAKDRGRAPNLSWSASALADTPVKWPVMLAVPAHRDAWADGAEITWLSSTIPNRLRGSGSDTMREVTLQNAVVPAPLKSSRTSHWPLLTPPWPVCWSEVALEIWSPFTSAGPRMYFSGWVGSLEQVTIGWDAMSWMASTCLGLAQLSPASCFSSAGVTHARSLAFFGLAPGAGVAAVARGVAVGVAAVARGVAVGVAAVGAGFVAAVSADGNPC